MDKVEAMILAVICAIIFFAGSLLIGKHIDGEVCQAKGGVYAEFGCMKKELFIQ